MRRVFAHEAILVMQPDADLRAPGALITTVLCGHWNHRPPCPLAAHHTRAERVGSQVHLRTLFATEPETEDIVRQRIEHALSGGQFRSPNTVITRWQLHTSRPTEVVDEEAGQAERLTRT